MTSFDEIYSAFLTHIEEDEWENWQLEEAKADWHAIMESALPWFRFPKTSLERNEEAFLNTLTPTEIQIIASFMKCEWLNRCLATWDNIKPLYSERDFSPGNLLDKMRENLDAERRDAREMESIYYRSTNEGKPFNYSRLAGNTYEN